MQLLGTLIACLASFPGCGGPPVAEELRQPLPPVSSFVISYKRGGGFAPINEGLSVTPGRHAVATSDGSRAGERKVSFRIGKGRVRALQTGLQKAGFGSIESGVNGGCADCYLYEIRYRGHRVSFDQSVIPEGLEPVIGEIESVISARTIPPNF